MTPVDAPSPTRDAATQYHPPPRLGPHPLQASLGHDKLAARVDLQGIVPVGLFHVLNVADATTGAGVGDEDRNRVVLGGYFGLAQDVGDEGACDVAVAEVSAGGGEELRGVFLA